MDHHPIPRQITTFEFKLIGFLTLKQFAYLALFSVVGILFFFTIPSDLFINVLVGVVVALIGVAFAFIKINERPLDLWITNFSKKLLSPSQYFYMKNNRAPLFLIDMASHPYHDVDKHVDAQQKLDKYLQTGDKKAAPPSQPPQANVPTSPAAPPASPAPDPAAKAVPAADTTPPAYVENSNSPYLFGTIANKKELPLPNALIHVRSQSGDVVRILKTNHNGVFATYHPLQPGTYTFETKDLEQKYFFDTMTVDVTGPSAKPLSIHSKEVI